ncbi:MAG: folate family ECF transporter S component [Clostridiales Family XIII bacterium]|nr:folate family ECF transporter S component [Clostridiales Family XIII bacterium]
MMSEKNSGRGKIPLSGLILIAFFIALELILNRVLSINTPVIRVSLAFLPLAATAILYGPLWAAAACVIEDLIGATLFPTGAFFPGFTLTALLTGLTFGLFLHGRPIHFAVTKSTDAFAFTFGLSLHGRPVTWKSVLPAAAIICVLYNLCLDSFWLYIIMGKGVLALMPVRLIKVAVMLPLETTLIPLVWHYIGKAIPAGFRPSV